MNKGCYYCKHMSNKLSGYCNNIEIIKENNKEWFDPVDGKPLSERCSKFNSKLDCSRFEQIELNRVLLWFFRRDWAWWIIMPSALIAIGWAIGFAAGKGG